VGIEAIGLNDPAIDAEVISVAYFGYRNLGLKKFRLDVTSLGDSTSRAHHRVELMKFIDAMNIDDATRARATLNPLRLFDDKREDVARQMASAPLLRDFLTEESKNHFAQVLSYLDALEIPYSLNPRMVRGLDYYTGTTFEFVHELLGAQSGIGGGGRYDGLMESLGGQKLSGIGFGLGVDRTLLACEAEGIDYSTTNTPDLFLIPLGDGAMNNALALAGKLRNAGFIVDLAFGDRSLKGAMKAADKSGARFSLVLGEDEIASGRGELKEMSTGSAQSVTLSALESALSAR
jgi:histidyl-tRNA synthetase